MTANRHVQADISVITAISNKALKKLLFKQKMLPNQNCEHQVFFHKKKRYSSTPTLSRNKIEKILESFS